MTLLCSWVCMYDQAGLQLYTTEKNLDKDIDEGFKDVKDETGSIPLFP